MSIFKIKYKLLQYNAFIILFFWHSLLFAFSIDENKIRCNKGNMYACAVLGFQYKPYDTSQAVKYLSKSCNGGLTLGCGALGIIYSKIGENKKAIPLLEKACYSMEVNKQNSPAIQEICISLTHNYGDDNLSLKSSKYACNIEKNYKEVTPISGSQITSCDEYKFNLILINPNTIKQKFIKRLKTYCNNNDADSCMRLSRLYTEKYKYFFSNITSVLYDNPSYSVEDDEKNAIKYANKSCDIDKSHCELVSSLREVFNPPVSPTSGSVSNYNKSSTSSCRTEVYTQYRPGTRQRVQQHRRVCN